ncbi:MAG: hypothetical protein B6U78_03040 [Candidatus Aenigmarchaeota archaeon ex4484_224]|nr:MAG: hypothetical protein B6U78_03040 [Candidatus Aenigmarchaeota archaeon ex4484_224]
MILTERKPFGVIKGILEENGFKKIAILACNGCARFCETGGESYLNELAKRLEENGFEVKIKKLIPLLCDIDLIKREVSEEEIKEVDCIIPLACIAGIYATKKLFPNKKIIEAIDTIGIAIRDERGDIFLVKDLREEIEEIRKEIELVS